MLPPATLIVRVSPHVRLLTFVHVTQWNPFKVTKSMSATDSRRKVYSILFFTVLWTKMVIDLTFFLKGPAMHKILLDFLNTPKASAWPNNVSERKRKAWRAAECHGYTVYLPDFWLAPACLPCREENPLQLNTGLSVSPNAENHTGRASPSCTVRPVPTPHPSQPKRRHHVQYALSKSLIKGQTKSGDLVNNSLLHPLVKLLTRIKGLAISMPAFLTG